MIPQTAITEWSEFVSWRDEVQVEQDLIICKALVAELLTYQLDELMGTKLRALYQRRKGRDLYDLFKVLTMANVNVDNVIRCYREYMAFVVDHSPTHKEYVLNMEEKMQDDEFLGDTKNLLRSGDTFDPVQGYEIVKKTLIDRI